MSMTFSIAPRTVRYAHAPVKSKRTQTCVQLALMARGRKTEVLPDVALRLVQARERAGYRSAADACRAFGWSYDTYVQHERGERGIPRAAARYAAAYRVPEGWLLTGEGSPDGPIPATTVPVISWVSAGKMQVADADPDAPRIPITGLPEGRWIALEVEGDSMDRISPPGSRIFVNTADRKLVPNACYVISGPDGAASYKRYRPNPDRFEPVSTNPVHEPLFPDGEVTILGRVRRSMIDM